jgi:hypothetical protein
MVWLNTLLPPDQCVARIQQQAEPDLAFNVWSPPRAFWTQTTGGLRLRRGGGRRGRSAALILEFHTWEGGTAIRCILRESPFRRFQSVFMGTWFAFMALFFLLCLVVAIFGHRLSIQPGNFNPWVGALASLCMAGLGAISGIWEDRLARRDEAFVFDFVVRVLEARVVA